jgi:hypothetical protein
MQEQVVEKVAIHAGNVAVTSSASENEIAASSNLVLSLSLDITAAYLSEG